MTLQVSNIIVGPCTSMVYDGINLGTTVGGVQVLKERTYTDIRVDNVPFVVSKVPKEDIYSVKTTLAENTMQNLAISWAVLLENGNLIRLGVNSFDLSKHTLVFTGPGPNGKTRTFTLYNVVSASTSGPTMAKDQATVIPVYFQCLPDFSQPKGQEYGTIVEE
jgi:hypothetical protein